MSQGKRALFYGGLVAILTLISSFLAFLYSYNAITKPLLTDEQRLESSQFVFAVTLPSYLVISIAIGGLVFLLIGGQK